MLYHFPVVILVDPMTASAAEIISGALQARGDVTLVGQKTFGKGLVQQVLPLEDENLLKLTVAEYILSGDRAINEKGIPPDIELFPVAKSSVGAARGRARERDPLPAPHQRRGQVPGRGGATFLREPRPKALVDARKLRVRRHRARAREARRDLVGAAGHPRRAAAQAAGDSR